MYLRASVILLCAFPTASPQDRPSFHSKVDMVVVSCSVLDANDLPVAGLTRDDFRVYDNGQRRVIQKFWIEEDAPLTLGIIIDASESQRDRVAEHMETAGELQRQLVRTGDRAFVVTVNEEVRLGQELFGDPCAKRDSMGPACGSSPLWNAVYDAAQIKLLPASGKKALLMLTDGFDSGSNHTWNDAAAAINQAGASFYAIRYQGYGGGVVPDLFPLVEETGGILFRPPNGDYRKIVSRIQADLHHRYGISFRPDQVTGRGRHEIRVETTRPDLTVRSRKTYFEDRQ